jgi:cellulose synthase/poly-beta-1,6-N-acetylglucosamine synthase-like glycosyltransferase
MPPRRPGAWVLEPCRSHIRVRHRWPPYLNSVRYPPNPISHWRDRRVYTRTSVLSVRGDRCGNSLVRPADLKLLRTLSVVVVPEILTITAIAMTVSLAGLLVLGARWRRMGIARCAAYALGTVGIAAAAGSVIWDGTPSGLWVGAGLALGAALVAGATRRDWNPPAQALFGTMALTCPALVVYAADFALSNSLSPLAYPASAILLALEAFAFTLLLIGTHETLDTAARVRWRRRAQATRVEGFAPFVSVHVPTHNEPPELVLETLAALRRLDYPAYEVLVLDNNTDDPGLWHPVARYCEEVGFRFVHLENWPGFKAGALNHGLELCDPRSEIVAVVDADFVVEPDFLQKSVGGFHDPNVGIVQTAQKFRADASNGYLRNLELTYRTFDEISMPSRNERNGIIFAGTMGLIRRQALVESGGWGEWCVTEDAELSLRILARGYDAVYLEDSFGAGVMPLTFAGLKRQRFRWCLGGIQLLRAHWRLLVFGRGVASDGAALSLTRAQRYDYLAAALQWFMPLLTVVFAFLLLASVIAHAVGDDLAIRPLTGLFVAVPMALLVSGLVRALWGLRARLEVRWRDTAAVMAIFLGLSWAVALACIRGLTGSGAAFLRTPKFRERESLTQTLQATRAEVPLAIALTAAALISALSWPGIDALFIGALCAWSALIFWSAPATAFVASRMELRSTALEARRRLEFKRGRPPSRRQAIGFAYATATAFALVALILPGLANAPGGSVGDLFRHFGGESVSRAASGGQTGPVRKAAPADALALRREARSRSRGSGSQHRSTSGTTLAAQTGTRTTGSSPTPTPSTTTSTQPPTTTPPTTTPTVTTPPSTGSTASSGAPVDHPTSQPTDPSSTRPTSSPTTPAPDHPTGQPDVASSGP